MLTRTGIGVDGVDLSVATRLGIAICNTPDAPTISAAEHTWALILWVTKGLDQASHHHPGYQEWSATELSGQKLGLVGLGRIGQRVAAMAQAMEMEVIGFDPYQDRDWLDQRGVQAVDTLEELVEKARILSLHLPVTPETHQLVNQELITRMSHDTYLINTARGGLVDHQALAEALAEGRLGGAGLDVTDPEPLPDSHPLWSCPRTIITPHVATATDQARVRLFQAALAGAEAVCRGEKPPSLVNPKVWRFRRKFTE